MEKSTAKTWAWVLIIAAIGVIGYGYWKSKQPAQPTIKP